MISTRRKVFLRWGSYVSVGAATAILGLENWKIMFYVMVFVASSLLFLVLDD